jgi:hypothetical protein
VFPGGAGWGVPLRRLLRDVGAPPRKFVMDTTIRRLITLNSQLSPPARASSSCWRGAWATPTWGPLRAGSGFTPAGVPDVPWRLADVRRV